MVFIHIGNNNIIRSRDIVSIVDHNTLKSSSIMGEMIDNGTKENKVIGPIKDSKSIVLTSDFIYYSTLSVVTLKKRSSSHSMVKKAEKYHVEIKQ